MFKRPALFVSLVVVLVLSGLALGCNGDDDDGEAQSEIEETVRRLSAAGPDDVDFFLNHVTDGFLETFVGVSSEECRANAEQCVGEPDEAVAVQNTSVDGDRATSDVTFGDGFEARPQMVREDGVWKLDEFTSIPREIPEGVTRVDLEMGEFYFDFDEAEVRDGGLRVRHE